MGTSKNGYSRSNTITHKHVLTNSRTYAQARA